MIEQEITHRGYSLLNNQWVYGRLLDYSDKLNVIVVELMGNCGMNLNLVQKDSVGKYMGFSDSNGKMVFSGDILSVTIPDREESHVRGDLVHCDFAIHPGDPVIAHFDVMAKYDEYSMYLQDYCATSIYETINKTSQHVLCNWNMDRIRNAYFMNYFSYTKRGFSWERDYNRLCEIYNISCEDELESIFGVRVVNNTFEVVHELANKAKRMAKEINSELGLKDNE